MISCSLAASQPHEAAISCLRLQLSRVPSPELHLVWYYDTIYIKPIPRYLLSHAFWRFLVSLPDKTELLLAAKGFLRTYAFLVRHESDLRVAMKEHLIPEDAALGAISLDRFANFISAFADIGDGDVSARYSSGELRLTRLNFYSRIFLSKLTFHNVDAQMAPFLNAFLTPFLIIFAILTVVLSAMQVGLAVEVTPDDEGYNTFVYASKGFAMFGLVLTSIASFSVIFLITFMFVHNTLFAMKVARRKLRGRDNKNMRSGIV
jgi:hypothetical protein